MKVTLLALSLGSFLLLGSGCVLSPETRADGLEEGAEDQPVQVIGPGQEVVQSPAFPEDILFMEGAQLDGAEVDGHRAWAAYFIKNSPAEVASWYAAALAPTDWKKFNSATVENRISDTYRKGNAWLNIIAEQGTEDAPTSVMVTHVIEQAE
jgi:hypothetical protein